MWAIIRCSGRAASPTLCQGLTSDSHAWGSVQQGLLAQRLGEHQELGGGGDVADEDAPGDEHLAHRGEHVQGESMSRMTRS